MPIATGSSRFSHERKRLQSLGYCRPCVRENARCALKPGRSSAPKLPATGQCGRIKVHFWSRLNRKPSVLRVQFEADRPDRDDDASIAGRVELAAQIADLHVDDVGVSGG